jgi:predicted NUDIX family NTP pyrophosphohydrolase
MYRRADADIEVFLVHPGGPFWAKKDNGAWSIPKGEYEEVEDAQDAARREFHEETGFTAEAAFLDLGVIKQAGGKAVAAWACEGNCDPQLLKSNLCKIEWPPRSKHLVEIPEVDRAGWFSIPPKARGGKVSRPRYIDVSSSNDYRFNQLLSRPGRATKIKSVLERDSVGSAQCMRMRETMFGPNTPIDRGATCFSLRSSEACHIPKHLSS